jgi:hypothetical protein
MLNGEGINGIGSGFTCRNGAIKQLVRMLQPIMVACLTRNCYHSLCYAGEIYLMMGQKPLPSILAALPSLLMGKPATSPVLLPQSVWGSIQETGQFTHAWTVLHRARSGISADSGRFKPITESIVGEAGFFRAVHQ